MLYALLLRDVIEITFYSFIIYAFCIWLKTDKTKNILGYFLSYCITILVAWFFDLPTLATFLLSYSPVAVIILIVLHEKTLQRNLVTLRTITPAQTPDKEWLDIVLSVSLSAINNNQSITFVIENHDALDYFLTAPFFLNANVSKNIFPILLSHSSYDEHKIIWITADGTIRAINTVWKTENTTHSPLNAQIVFNKKDAIFYTCASDALVLHANPTERAFTLICQGKEIQHISTHSIKNVFTKNLYKNTPTSKEGKSHESNTTKTTTP